MLLKARPLHSSSPSAVTALSIPVRAFEHTLPRVTDDALTLVRYTLGGQFGQTQVSFRVKNYC